MGKRRRDARAKATIFALEREAKADEDKIKRAEKRKKRMASQMELEGGTPSKSAKRRKLRDTEDGGAQYKDVMVTDQLRIDNPLSPPKPTISPEKPSVFAEGIAMETDSNVRKNVKRKRE